MFRNERKVLGISLFILALGLVCTAAAGQTQPAPGPRSQPATLTLEIVPTVFLVKAGDALDRLVDVMVDNPGLEAEATLSAVVAGRAVVLDPASGKLRVKPGKNAFRIRVPEVNAPAPAHFALFVTPAGVGAKTVTLSRNITLRPQRRWMVYLFHHSHNDIGYTQLQSRVGRNHIEYLDSVIDYCHATDAYPDDAKFRWNIEVSWALEYYKLLRPEAKFRELIDLIRAGRVELSGIQFNISDGYSHEELIRAVEQPRELARRYGIELRSAMNDDVTGWSWALPQIFSQNGVRYFATGINETRSRAPLRRPCAWWWESADGSRVLEWEGEHYLFGNTDLLLHELAAKSAPKVGDYLAKLEARGDYPQDIIAFNIGAWTTDNCPPGRDLSDRVKDWNETYAFPRLRLATLHEFFENMETRYGASLPVHKLGWPDYWTDGVASTAFETGLNRRTHNDLITAEKLSVLAAKLDPDKGFRYPAEEIRQTYDLSMLYDEHTWGAWSSIDEPWTAFSRGQWALKSSFAYIANETPQTLIKRGLTALGRLISADGDFEFAVFNPLSWDRTDVVRVMLPAGPLRDAKGNFRVIDRRSGSDANFQPDGDEAILVVACDIPSLGYAVFGIEPAKGQSSVGPAATGAPASSPAAPSAAPPAPAGNIIENRFYRVTVDPATGGITSLFDKELARELVDSSCPYPLNTYIYEQPEGGRKAVDDMEKRAVFHRWMPESAKLETGRQGPTSSSLVVKSSAKMCPTLEQRIILYDDVKRIDLTNILHKEATFNPEAVYFAFPFDVGPGFAESAGKMGKVLASLNVKTGMRGPNVRFEISDGDMVPETEQLPGTTRDWETVQHWVEFAGRNARVVWSPVEAPLVEFGDINTGKWLKRLDITNAWVFSYAMNNYWMTNFKASQDGIIEFNYSLTSGPAAGGPDRVAASRFGWEVHTPLAVAWLPTKCQGRFGTPTESFVSVSEPNVIIQALMLDEDGTPVVRLREIAGRDVNARLASAVFLGFTMRSASGRAETKEAESIPVHLKPFEFKTVKLVK